MMASRALSPTMQQTSSPQSPKKYIEGPSPEFLARMNKTKKEPIITDWDLYRKRHNLRKKHLLRRGVNHSLFVEVYEIST